MPAIFYSRSGFILILMKTILITGATGFIGLALVQSLLDQHTTVIAGVRQHTATLPQSVTQVELGDLAQPHKQYDFLQDIGVIIHTAARAHIMQESASNPLAEFRKINTVGTLNLARQAAQAGVKRFIFISSIKVNGEMTEPGAPFTAENKQVPTDPYGLSKYEAEQGLMALADETGMEVVIIRPPLVYGPGVKANFAAMINWINKGVPLPFGAIHNQRSLVALDNLVSFIMLCIDHPKAANEIFLIADGEDVSTTELLQKVAKALGKNTCLLPIPTRWMNLAAQLISKRDVAQRLFSSLQIDNSKARNLLGWHPVSSMDQQLRKTAKKYREDRFKTHKKH